MCGSLKISGNGSLIVKERPPIGGRSFYFIHEIARASHTSAGSAFFSILSVRRSTTTLPALVKSTEASASGQWALTQPDMPSEKSRHILKLSRAAPCLSIRVTACPF